MAEPNAELFRKAWGKFATGVSLLTTIQPDGEVHGMSANGITSVSLEPLCALVCVGHNRNSYPLIKEQRRFAINILREEQEDIGEYYARPPEKRTGEVSVSFAFTENGSAVLDDSLAYMDCHVLHEYVCGDHTIFIGKIDEIQVNEGKPLLFYESRFGRLSQDGAAG